MSMLKLESFFFFSFFLFLAGCGNQSKPVSVEQEIITPLSAGNAVNDLLPYILHSRELLFPVQPKPVYSDFRTRQETGRKKRRKKILILA